MSNDTTGRFCGNCGIPLTDGAVSCPRCGAVTKIEEGYLSVPTIIKSEAHADSAGVEDMAGPGPAGTHENRTDEVQMNVDPASYKASEDLPQSICGSCGAGIPYGVVVCPHCGGDPTKSAPSETAPAGPVPDVEDQGPAVSGPQEADAPVQANEMDGPEQMPFQTDESTSGFPVQCGMCGKTITSSDRFCAYCGTDQTVVLPKPLKPPAPKRRWRKASSIVPMVVTGIVIVMIAAILFTTLSGSYDMTDRGSQIKDLTFSWTYDGAMYEVELEISEETYDHYANQDIDRGMSTKQEYVLIYDYCTSSDATVLKLASMLEDIATAANMTEYQLLSLTLSFVQSIAYVSDTVTYGQEEYWAFPVETLYLKAGDCEDKSFLYASLVEAMGADAVVLLYDDHVATGVNVTGASGWNYEYNDIKYYYAETTATGWTIGHRLPEGYNEAEIIDI